MRYEAVRTPEDHHMTVAVVRLGKAHLVSKELAVAPPVPHELKTDGIEEILPAEAVDEGPEKHPLALAAAGSPADAADGAGAVFVQNFAQTRADLGDRLIPGNPFKFPVHLFHGIIQPIAVLHKVTAVAPLAADVAVASRTVFVRAAGDDPVILHLYFNAAAHAADGTLCFLPFAHTFSPSVQILCFYFIRLFPGLQSFYRCLFWHNSQLLCQHNTRPVPLL